MTDYTITKTENSTTINVPIGRKYKNKLNGNTYKNSSEGVKLLTSGQNWRRVGSAYLESITLGGDITETGSMTLNFKTQTGVTVPVEASTKPSELLSNLDEQVSLNDFYIDYLSTVGARVHLADYINTVLVDIYENQEVLSELIETTPETPEPSTPDTPDTPTPSEPAIKTSTTISTSKGDLTITLQGTVQGSIQFGFTDSSNEQILFDTYSRSGGPNTLTLDSETGETITVQAICNSTIPAAQSIYQDTQNNKWKINGSFPSPLSNYGLRVTYHPATGEDTVEDLMVGIPPLEVTTGGGELTNLIHLPTGDIYFQPTINLNNQSTIILNAYNLDGTAYTDTKWFQSDTPQYKEGDNTLVTIEATEVTINGETNNTVQVYYPHMNDGKLELRMTNTQRATINIKNEAIIKVQVTYADSEEPEVITVTG